jgi:hypothetical protein
MRRVATLGFLIAAGLCFPVGLILNSEFYTSSSRIVGLPAISVLIPIAAFFWKYSRHLSAVLTHRVSPWGSYLSWLSFYALYVLPALFLMKPTLGTLPCCLVLVAFDLYLSLRADASQKAELLLLPGELDHVGPREIAQLQARNKKIPFVDLERQEISRDVLALVPPETIQKHLVLPVKRDGHRLWIATTNVNDWKAQDALRNETGLANLPCLVTEEDMLSALERYFPAQERDTSS